MQNATKLEQRWQASGGKRRIITILAILFTTLTIGQASASTPVQYVTGDFNGDGITDLLAVTQTGTYEYLGLARGGFTDSVWSNPYLTLGKVQYTAGHFSGGPQTDLIVTTGFGSYEYLGMLGGGFTTPAPGWPDAYVRGAKMAQSGKGFGATKVRSGGRAPSR